MPFYRCLCEGEIVDIRLIQEDQRGWIAHNFGSRPSWQPLLGVQEEVGELSHAHLKEAQGIRTHEDHEEQAKDACADIVIFLMDYCSARGWDLVDLVEMTWDEVRKRDWKADSEHAHEGGQH